MIVKHLEAIRDDDPGSMAEWIETMSDDELQAETRERFARYLVPR